MEKIGVDVVYTFRFLNYIRSTKVLIVTSGCMRRSFIVVLFSMRSFSSRLFIKETIDVCPFV